MTKAKVTRNDDRFSCCDYDSEMRVWLNDSLVGYWDGDDIEEFKEAILDELIYATTKTEAVEAMELLVFEECVETDEYGDPIWSLKK